MAELRETKQFIKSAFSITSRNRAVYYLFALLFVKSLAFAILIPPWMGNDEPNHFEYVLKLAGGGDNSQAVIIESLNRTNFWKRAEMRGPAEGASQFKQTDLRNHSEDIAGKRPFLYYWTASLPLRAIDSSGILSKLLAARFISIIISMVALWFLFLSANIVFEGRNQALYSNLAVTIAGFHPQYSHLSAVVNSDVLLIAVFSFIFFLFVRLIRRGNISVEDIIVILFALGLAFLTKKHALILIPVILIGFFLVEPFKEGYARKTGRTYLMFSFFMLAAILLLEFFAAKSMINIIDRLGLSFAYSFSSFEELKAVSFVQWGKGISVMFVTYWFTYGQMVHKFSFGFYAIYAAFTAVVFFGIVRGAVKNLKGLKNGKSPFMRYLFFAAVFVALVLIANVVTFFSPALIHRVSGRYFFYALAPIALLTVFGISNIMPSGKEPDKTGNLETVIARAFIAMNVITIFGYLIPIYHA